MQAERRESSLSIPRRRLQSIKWNAMNKLAFLLFASFSFLWADAQENKSYQSLLDSATVASSTNRYEKAIKFYNQVLELDPQNEGNCLVWGNLGSVYERMGKVDEALSCYTKSLEIQPKLLPVLEQRAGLYLDKGDKGRAMQDFTAILNEQPEHEQALLGRAYLRMQQNMYPEARLDFESLLLNYPQNKHGELGLAILCQKQERYQESAERFARLIERYPADPDLYEARGNMEREAKWYELALIDYEEAGRISKNEPLYDVMQAQVYLDQKKKSSARRMLDRAVRGGLSKASLEEYYSQCK